eukprot:CAMPEP_0183332986 /NCGR_PEP_ID=MMETSP0164_2-20130417/2013_1 /TAXON_ID=221442 /ORGANISM="Coccolithus pelagicus ssp braarudi, Strain PLY182g" /LENGTH=63 /DNA_ID=CAMNT_0025501809 /DNA_START=648 /DNA_END=839 /DNA_ORIENTATION=+
MQFLDSAEEIDSEIRWCGHMHELAARAPIEVIRDLSVCVGHPELARRKVATRVNDDVLAEVVV